MPELPEVETSRRGIEPHLLNKTITEIKVRQHKLRWPVPKKLPSLATGKKITGVYRRAKYLILELENRGSIIIHLGMSGSLRICSDETAIDTHDHIDICVSSRNSKSKILRLRDPRKFGCVLWTERDVYQHKLLKPLGPEPLESEFDAHYLHNMAHKRQCSIKALIMNSHIIAGVGNIYACEALFRAGINPKRKAGNISFTRMARLVDAIKQTLSEAIEQGGTTLRDFTAEDGKPGYFAQKLLVYGRAGHNCIVCNNPVKQIVQQGRSTFYCPVCQK